MLPGMGYAVVRSTGMETLFAGSLGTWYERGRISQNVNPEYGLFRTSIQIDIYKKVNNLLLLPYSSFLSLRSDWVFTLLIKTASTFFHKSMTLLYYSIK